MKRLTSPVDLELVYVALTSAEITLLACLQRLVLSRVVERAPEGSGVRAEAKKLLDGVDHWSKRPVDDVIRPATASLTDGYDDGSLEFPSPAYTALCNRALARKGAPRGRGRGGDDNDAAADDDDFIAGKLVHAAFAIDEIGGVANWRKVLGLLEGVRGDVEGDRGDGGGGGGKSGPELQETIGVLKAYLPEDVATGAVAERDAGGSRAAGSKLSQIALLLEQHKQECDESGEEFSALVLVSRWDLAARLPETLEAIPSLKPFVKAKHITGQSHMTLERRVAALASFENGSTTVLVSTSSVCGDVVDVPASALVVCTSLSSGGAELAQLRGRIRSHGAHTRFERGGEGGVISK